MRRRAWILICPALLLLLFAGQADAHKRRAARPKPKAAPPKAPRPRHKAAPARAPRATTSKTPAKRVTEKQAKKLKRKWSRRLSADKRSYFSVAGRYLFMERTIDRLKKQDASKKELASAREKRDGLRKKEKRGFRKIQKDKRQVKRYGRIIERYSTGVHAGKGWGGSEGVADTAKRIARKMGIPVTSQKRTYAETIAVGSSTASDHYTGNTTAFAVDFGTSGSRGTELARKLCSAYGISTSVLGTYTGTIIRVDGRSYRIQILWHVSGHYDHVHIGIRRY